MISINKSILIGRLVRDVEQKTTASGISVANFTLAVDRRFKSEGQPTVDFIPVVVWGKTAEFSSRYFSKGLRIAVVGRIQTRTWEDNEGKKRYVTEVVGEEVEFADGKKNGNTPINNSEKNKNYSMDEDSEELPF
jgi:single-strand DNA-binding protein